VSFTKILVANRGDNRSEAKVAAQAQFGIAEVSRSQTASCAQRTAIEPRGWHV